MTEKEKELKAFNQCADALSQLDRKSVMKVFQLLTVHYDMIPSTSDPAEVTKGDDSKKVEPLKITPTSSLSKKNEDHATPVVKKNSKPKSGSAKEPTHLIDYDFRPAGKESLKDFFEKYKAKNNLEYNLVFIYYLQNIIGESTISVNHIYSCYRHLNISLPVFPQTLIDTKHRKGWIDTSDLSNIRLVREGINFLEHEMSKRQ